MSWTPLRHGRSFGWASVSHLYALASKLCTGNSLPSFRLCTFTLSTSFLGASEW